MQEEKYNINMNTEFNHSIYTITILYPAPPVKPALNLLSGIHAHNAPQVEHKITFTAHTYQN